MATSDFNPPNIPNIDTSDYFRALLLKEKAQESNDLSSIFSKYAIGPSLAEAAQGRPTADVLKELAPWGQASAFITAMKPVQELSQAQQTQPYEIYNKFLEGVKTEKDIGFTDEQIKKQILENKWYPSDINSQIQNRNAITEGQLIQNRFGNRREQSDLDYQAAQISEINSNIETAKAAAKDSLLARQDKAQVEVYKTLSDPIQFTFDKYLLEPNSTPATAWQKTWDDITKDPRWNDENSLYKEAMLRAFRYTTIPSIMQKYHETKPPKFEALPSEDNDKDPNKDNIPIVEPKNNFPVGELQPSSGWGLETGSPVPKELPRPKLVGTPYGSPQWEFPSEIPKEYWDITPEIPAKDSIKLADMQGDLNIDPKAKQELAPSISSNTRYTPEQLEDISAFRQEYYEDPKRFKEGWSRHIDPNGNVIFVKGSPKKYTDESTVQTLARDYRLMDLLKLSGESGGWIFGSSSPNTLFADKKEWSPQQKEIVAIAKTLFENTLMARTATREMRRLAEEQLKMTGGKQLKLDAYIKSLKQFTEHALQQQAGVSPRPPTTR